MLVDTAHLLILGSFYELKVRIIHDKIRYVCFTDYKKKFFDKHKTDMLQKFQYKFFYVIAHCKIEYGYHFSTYSIFGKSRI